MEVSRAPCRCPSSRRASRRPRGSRRASSPNGSASSEADAYRAGLVATELATNLVKHAQAAASCCCGRTRGADAARSRSDRHRPRARAWSTFAPRSRTAIRPPDRRAPVSARSGGCPTSSTSTRGAGDGTVVLARLRAQARPCGGLTAFEFAGVSVAKAGETGLRRCLAACTIDADGCSALVADGLGHGLHAARSGECGRRPRSTAARRRAAAPTRLKAMHAALRHTRGAAAAIAEIAAARARLVKFAGVGNIAAAIVHRRRRPPRGVASTARSGTRRGSSASTATRGSRMRCS